MPTPPPPDPDPNSPPAPPPPSTPSLTARHRERLAIRSYGAHPRTVPHYNFTISPLRGARPMPSPARLAVPRLTMDPPVIPDSPKEPALPEPAYAPLWFSSSRGLVATPRFADSALSPSPEGPESAVGSERYGRLLMRGRGAAVRSVQDSGFAIKMDWGKGEPPQVPKHAEAGKGR